MCASCLASVLLRLRPLGEEGPLPSPHSGYTCAIWEVQVQVDQSLSGMLSVLAGNQLASCQPRAACCLSPTEDMQPQLEFAQSAPCCTWLRAVCVAAPALPCQMVVQLSAGFVSQGQDRPQSRVANGPRCSSCFCSLLRAAGGDWEAGGRLVNLLLRPDPQKVPGWTRHEERLRLADVLL